MPANYNNSAWFYDPLCRLVYGRALINAQLFLLKFILPEFKGLLIAGGGTGWILEEISRIYAEGLDITYVEIAPKMMALSQKRNIGSNKVIFTNEAVENVPLATDFDIVITPFLFDNFTQANFERIFSHIHSALKPRGLWLNCDFQSTGKWWQRVLLTTMFWFFRLICNIEAKKLPEIERQFDLTGYKSIGEQNFYGNFIHSKIYQRAGAKQGVRGL